MGKIAFLGRLRDRCVQGAVSSRQPMSTAQPHMLLLLLAMLSMVDHVSSFNKVHVLFKLSREDAESHWTGHAAEAMQDSADSKPELKIEIESMGWSGMSLASEMEFVQSVVDAYDNTTAFVWQPVDPILSKP